MRTYAIADLHGRFDLLQLVIAQVLVHKGSAPGRFVCLGDFVDRGPESSRIIKAFRQWNQPGLELVVLQGNHEAMILQCLDGNAQLSWWIGNGGGQTLMSYGYAQGDLLRPYKYPLGQDMFWLRQLPVTFEDNHRIFVHAGVRHDLPVAETKRQTLQWMLYPDGEVYHGAEHHPDLPHMSGKHVVHGHHQSATHPLQLPHRTNLDSFAWYTGRVVVGVFDDSQARPIDFIELQGEAA